jgi:UDP-N-acetylmuramyl pentapeptide phosphotransferase/UDP-N-acetylglucosamine-1-phosphate transferase
VHALPLILSAAVALVLAPGFLRALTEAGRTHENYRGALLPFPAGGAIVAAAALTVAPLALLHELADSDTLPAGLSVVVPYVLGTAFLGLLDDVVGGSHARGWRGHAGAVLGGAISTGALKAAGSLGLALYVLADRGLSSGAYILAVLLLALTTNLFNLLDLRPGRAWKAFLLLGAGLLIGSQDADPLWALGLFAGPVLVLGLYDVRERAMLGDTGSNLIGGLAGLWMVLELSTTGQGIALAVVLAITVYGEFRSISEVVEKVRPLRALDSLGRPE